MKDNVNVFFAVNDTYVKFMVVTMYSILENTNAKISFFVLGGNDSISEATKRKLYFESYKDRYCIKYIRIDDKSFANFKRSAKHITLEANYRLCIASLCPEIDKCIYLDSDLICTGDISELWNIDISKEYIGAVPKDLIGINSGVLLINLRKWREDELEKKFFEYAGQFMNDLRSVDQEILYKVCSANKGIRYLDDVYNFVPKFGTQMELKKVSPVIIHWAGTQKPWINKTVFGANEFWNYAKKTCFMEDIQKVPMNIINKPAVFFKFIAYYIFNVVTFFKNKNAVKHMYKYRLSLSIK